MDESEFRKKLDAVLKEVSIEELVSFFRIVDVTFTEDPDIDEMFDIELEVRV